MLKKSILFMAMVISLVTFWDIQCEAQGSFYESPQAITATNTIIQQADCPVVIKVYFAQHSKYSDLPKCVLHSVAFRNEKTKFIAAVRFRLISFNVFKEHMNTHDAYYIRKMFPVLPQVSGPDEGLEHAIWMQPHSDSYFLGHTVIYVDRIRFEDGSIWTANHNDVITQIRKISSQFSSSELESIGVSEPVASKYTP